MCIDTTAIVLSSTLHAQGSNGQLNLDCDGTANSNAGCGVTEWSRASYGPIFDAQGGGVFAMKWDDEGIAVCEFRPVFKRVQTAHAHAGSFYRAAVPQDVLNGQPNPSSWGEPVAMLAPDGCDPITNFVNHSIVFGEQSAASLSSPSCPLISPLDITFCGEANN